MSNKDRAQTTNNEEEGMFEGGTLWLTATNALAAFASFAFVLRIEAVKREKPAKRPS
jgi:hypothetical protein